MSPKKESYGSFVDGPPSDSTVLLVKDHAEYSRDASTSEPLTNSCNSPFSTEVYVMATCVHTSSTLSRCPPYTCPANVLGSSPMPYQKLLVELIVSIGPTAAAESPSASNRCPPTHVHAAVVHRKRMATVAFAASCAGTVTSTTVSLPKRRQSSSGRKYPSPMLTVALALTLLEPSTVKLRCAAAFAAKRTARTGCMGAADGVAVAVPDPVSELVPVVVAVSVAEAVLVLVAVALAVCVSDDVAEEVCVTVCVVVAVCVPVSDAVCVPDAVCVCVAVSLEVIVADAVAVALKDSTGALFADAERDALDDVDGERDMLRVTEGDRDAVRDADGVG